VDLHEDGRNKGDDHRDWRRGIIEYLENPGCSRAKKIRWLALKYTIINEELYRHTLDDILLKCLGEEQARLAMDKVHEGICGTHQSAPKMKWVLRRAGLYWPTMMDDCIRYKKGCEMCQRFGDIQTTPANELHPIVKPWPFRVWSLDFVGEIHPSSSKGHRFVLVSTDYFTKWT
jgi:hypothetical protein